MRFAFTEQQLELRAAVRQVLARECTPADLRALATPPDPGPSKAEGAATGDDPDPDPGRSADRWAVLSEMGVPGLLVPERYGGLGLTEVELVGVLEEAGWAGLPEPLAETAALAAPLLVDAAALAADGATVEAVVERCLPRLATGDLLAAVGGVDPSAAGPVVTTAEAGAPAGAAGPSGADDDAEPGGPRASTPRVAGGARAGLLLLASGGSGGPRQLHAVDAGAAWTSLTPSVDATRQLATVEWAPEAATVVASGIHAEALARDLLDRAAVAMAAQLLGLADRMITLATDYAKGRTQFGKPIGSFQAVKHHLADARVRLEFARPATYRAADSLARRLPDRSEHASMAKALASDAADLAARVALQVHGAIGYTWECDLHLFMKRAWALSAAWGDATTHRALVLARALDRLAS